MKVRQHPLTAGSKHHNRFNLEYNWIRLQWSYRKWTGLLSEPRNRSVVCEALRICERQCSICMLVWCILERRGGNYWTVTHTPIRTHPLCFPPSADAILADELLDSCRRELATRVTKLRRRRTSPWFSQSLVIGLAVSSVATLSWIRLAFCCSVQKRTSWRKSARFLVLQVSKFWKSA